MNHTYQRLIRGPQERSLLVMAAAILGIAAAPVLLSTPASAQNGPEFHACYVPGSGTVYRIKEPGLRAECSSAQHVEFSWDAEGEPGQDGVLGYEIVVFEEEVPSTTTFTFGANSAVCPTDKRVLGGGMSVTTPDGAFSGATEINRLQSFPATDGTAWIGNWGIENPNTQPFVIRIYAICALVDAGP